MTDEREVCGSEWMVGNRRISGGRGRGSYRGRDQKSKGNITLKDVTREIVR